MGWHTTGDSWADGRSGQGHGLPGLPAGFGHDGPWANVAPSAALAAALERAAGPADLYEGAETDALTGIARQWAAIESWAAAGKLATLRAMAREDSDGRPLLRRRPGLPDGWDDSLTYEISGALAMGPVSAGNLASLAWTLGTRLAGIGRLLADGTLTMAKAKLVAATFEPLDEREAARAEALVLGELAGKTYFQVGRLAWRAALAVAPDVAERRRSTAEREQARVTVFREESGAMGLSGRDLPAAQALSGHANVVARAGQYQASGAFPGQTTSSLEALAYVDLLSGISVRERIAFASSAAAQPPNGPGPDGGDDNDDNSAGPGDGGGGPGPSSGSGPNGGNGDGTGPGDGGGGPDPSSGPGLDDANSYGIRDPFGEDGDESGPDPSSDPGPDDAHPGAVPDAPGEDDGEDGPDSSSGPGPGDAHPGCALDPLSEDDSGGDGVDPGDSTRGPDEPADLAVPTSLVGVTVPLATLQGRTERAGENRLLGPLDPALARDLAAAAARSPRSRWEVTIVDEHGYATGHGIARPQRGASPQPQPPPTAPACCALPARVNITVTETFLRELQSQAPQPRPGAPPGAWELTLKNTGTWQLTLPGGQHLAVRFDVVPTHACDHRYRVNSYLPGERLRRLIQVRDRECTWPPCSRPAHASDFEHAVPYDQGGATDACNAGARSRRCHQVKQMPGWTVTQPKPGWHEWTTPTGRTYVQEPWRYIA